MGILSGLFRSRDKPTDRTAGSSYSFFLGGTASGKYVTERSAMQMTAVYCCVRILSEAVASLPLQFYRYTDDGGKEKAVEHPLYFLLHDEPNPEMTSFIFRETLMTHLLLWGNAYSQIIRNGKGEVVALYPLMPDRMKVDRDEHGRLYYEYTVYDSDDVDGRKDTNKVGRTVRLQPHDVLHIPGLGFDGLVGYSPIAMAKNAIGLAIATEEYGSKFFANGAAPSGVLEHPGTIKDPSKVRESWQATFGGSGNANKIAVLEEGMKYTSISISPEQAQFLETRKFQIDEIARIFRVPPHMIGDLEKSSFNNIEQQSLEFVKYTLDPWVSRWEQAMVRALLTPDEKKKYFFKFNVDGLLRGDYQSRMNGYATARQNGWMSANDIRELENLDRIPAEQGGDLYLINGNMTKLEDAGIFAAGNNGKEENSDEEVFICSHGQQTDEFSDCCKEQYPVQTMENIVWHSLKEHIKVLQEAGILMEADAKERIGETHKARGDLSAELALLKEQKIRQYEAYADGRTTKETYLKKKEMLCEKIERLEMQIKGQVSILGEQNDRLNTATQLLELTEKHAGADKITYEAVDAFIQDVYVYDPKHIEIVFRFEDELQEYYQRQEKAVV